MRNYSLRTPHLILRLLECGGVQEVSPKDRSERATLSLGRSLFASLLLLLLCLAAAKDLKADTISGTVKDPSGAVVVGARIEITGGSLAQALVLTSDESGKFTAADLIAGKYTVRVTKGGFEELV